MGFILNPYRYAGVGLNAWNPSDKNGDITLSNSNKDMVSASGSWRCARGVTGKSSGKWVYAVKVAVAGGGGGSKGAGVATSSADLTQYPGFDAFAWSHLSDGYKAHSGYSVFGDSWDSVNDIMMIAIDLAGDIWFGKNGTWMASGDPGAGTNPVYTGQTFGTVYPIGGMTSTVPKITGLFGADYPYTLPTGFSAWD